MEMINLIEFKKDRIFLHNVPSAIYIFIIIVIIFLTTAKGFFSLYNLKSIALQGSSLSIIALGMSLVMLTNGIDLSIGSTISLVSIVVSIILSKNFNIFIVIVIGIIIGCATGLLNGVLVTKLKLPSFIVTMGTMGMIGSAALVLSNGQTLYWEKNLFNNIAKKEFLIFPVPFLIALFLLFIIVWLFNFQSFGTYVKGIGNNEESIRLAGVKVNIFKIGSYIICGAFAAIAGIITTSRIASGNPTIGVGSEFEAVAAAAIGGISFFGGEGHPALAFFSGFVITILVNGLSLMGLSTAWQYVGIGVLLIMGMSLNLIKKFK